MAFSSQAPIARMMQYIRIHSATLSIFTFLNLASYIASYMHIAMCIASYSLAGYSYVIIYHTVVYTYAHNIILPFSYR